MNGGLVAMKIALHEMQHNVAGILAHIEVIRQEVDQLRQLCPEFMDSAENGPLAREEHAAAREGLEKLAASGRVVSAFGEMHRAILANLGSHLGLIQRDKSSHGHIEPVSVWDIVRDCIGMQDCLRDPRGVQFREPLLFGSGFIDGDGNEVRRAIINMLDNARKYSFRASVEGARFIEVLGRPWQHNGVMLRVTNFGNGVLPGEIDEVLKPSTRGLLASTDQKLGMGIGLSEVAKIARRHRGDFMISSRLAAKGLVLKDVEAAIRRGEQWALGLPWRTECTLRMQSVTE